MSVNELVFPHLKVSKTSAISWVVVGLLIAAGAGNKALGSEGALAVVLGGLALIGLGIAGMGLRWLVASGGPPLVIGADHVLFEGRKLYGRDVKSIGVDASTVRRQGSYYPVRIEADSGVHVLNLGEYAIDPRKWPDVADEVRTRLAPPEPEPAKA